MLRRKRVYFAKIIGNIMILDKSIESLWLRNFNQFLQHVFNFSECKIYEHISLSFTLNTACNFDEQER